MTDQQCYMFEMLILEENWTYVSVLPDTGRNIHLM